MCSGGIRSLALTDNQPIALDIAEADDVVLSTIEGEVLGTRFIRELLSLVDSAPNDMEWLTADRDRLQTERDRLIAPDRHSSGCLPAD